MEIETDMLFAKYRTQHTKAKKNIRMGEKIFNGVSNEALPHYPLRSLIMK